MNVITLDYETYWDSDFTLSKLSPLEYVLGDKFEVISCSIKYNGTPTDVVFGQEEVGRSFKRLRNILSESALLSHNNSGFDAYISSYVYGLKPRMWMCTAAMARPRHAKTTGVSLAKLVEYYGLGVKNNAVLMQTKGKRLKDFTEQELEDMKVYNRMDTDQCYALFQKLRPEISAKELWHIDAVTRMRVEPKFEVDTALLETALSIERDRKRKHILMLGRHLKSTNMGGEEVMAASTVEELEEAVRSEMASAPKFSALLTSLGVEVPMKPSPTNPENSVPALAKTDEAFTDMQEHENEIVAAAARARLAVKSTLVETRIEKFLTAARMTGGKLPIPIRYCGADTTGRDSGEEYNPQNLPRINPKVPKPADALRRCIRAPKGHKVVVADLSGIELRVNHILWKSPAYQLFLDNVEADLYKDFAAERYDVPVDEVSKDQRQMGKVCLAEGSMVLTDSGPKPIETVSVSDLLWDGLEWVHHDGPVYMGEKETIYHDGIEATPDHEVWVEDGRKVYLRDAAAQSLRLARTGAGRVPLGFGGAGVEGDRATLGVQVRDGSLRGVSDHQGGGVRQLAPGQDSGLPAVQAEMRCTTVAASAARSGAAALHQSERHVVQKLRRARADIRLPLDSGSGGVGNDEPGSGAHKRAGPHRQQYRLRTGEPSLGFAQAEHGQPQGFAHQAIPLVSAEPPRDTVRGHDTAAANKLRDDRRADSRAVLPPVRETKRRVWDILNAGPRNRFTANDRLVSNCHLGLGFGAGAPTFRRFAKVAYGLVIEEDESVLVVDAWRSKYKPIVDGWKTCGHALVQCMRGVKEAVDPWGLVTTDTEGLRLPSGRLIRYPDLRVEEDGTWPDGRAKKSMFYATGRHKARITGPKADENIVQALARDVIFDDALEFFRVSGLRPQLRVHDELVYVVPEKDAQQALDTLQGIMRTPPKWWPELVVWSEGDIADTYGDAK